MTEPRPRLALIGPVPPFRGGIAQHTAMLARALGGRAETLVVSFTRQYPGWLFPGESDVDPATSTPEDLDVRWLVDSLNPLTWERVVRAIRRFGPDAVVLPWWTIYWAPCFAYLARRLRAGGIPVLFFCHNVVDHEAAGWKRALTAAVLRAGSGFVAQSEAERERLGELLARPRVAVHPHPIYDHYPASQTALARRAAREFLFFGFVRPYKGLDVLLEAMARTAESDMMLTVAGEFWGGIEETRARIERLGVAGRVELIPRYVSEAETADLFARADALVMPYRSATGSGVLGLAYGYGKPVIASDVAGLKESVRNGETGLLVPPGEPDALARALDAMTAERAGAMRPAIAGFAATLTWDSLAEAVIGRALSASDEAGP